MHAHADLPTHPHFAGVTRSPAQQCNHPHLEKHKPGIFSPLQPYVTRTNIVHITIVDSHVSAYRIVNMVYMIENIRLD